MNADAPFRHDTALLQGVSRSFFLTLKALPRGLREPLGHAYLLARLSDTIADSSSDDAQVRLDLLGRLAKAVGGEAAPPMGKELAALAAGVESAAERRLLPRADALVAALAAHPGDVLAPMRAMLDTIIEGQSADIRRFESGRGGRGGGVVALGGAGELDTYTHQVAGCVGEFWTRLCSARLPGFSRRPLDDMVADGIRYGKALQLVNILRDFPDDLARGRCYLPGDELAAGGVEPGLLPANPRLAAPVYAKWIGIARGHLEAGGRYIGGVRARRLRFATALPADLAAATLALLGNGPPCTRLKISRASVRRIALRRLAATLLGR